MQKAGIIHLKRNKGVMIVLLLLVAIVLLPAQNKTINLGMDNVAINGSPENIPVRLINKMEFQVSLINMVDIVKLEVTLLLNNGYQSFNAASGGILLLLPRELKPFYKNSGLSLFLKYSNYYQVSQDDKSILVKDLVSNTIGQPRGYSEFPDVTRGSSAEGITSALTDYSSELFVTPAHLSGLFHSGSKDYIPIALEWDQKTSEQNRIEAIGITLDLGTHGQNAIELINSLGTAFQFCTNIDGLDEKMCFFVNDFRFHARPTVQSESIEAFDIILNLEHEYEYSSRMNLVQSISQEIDGEKLVISQQLGEEDVFTLVNQDGSSQLLNAEFRAVSYSLNALGEYINYDSENPEMNNSDELELFNVIIGESYQVKLTDKSEIISLEGIDELNSLLWQDYDGYPDWQNTLSDMGFYNLIDKDFLVEEFSQQSILYPKQRVAVGDSWFGEYTLTEFFPLSVSSVCMLSDVDNEFYYLNVNSKLSTLEEPHHLDYSGIEFELNGTSSERIKIHKNSGWIMDANIVQEINGKVCYEDISWPIDINSNMQLTGKIEKTSKIKIPGYKGNRPVQLTTSKIYGQVLGINGKPLPNILIFCANSGVTDYTITDYNGNYHFIKSPGYYSISVHSIPEVIFDNQHFSVALEMGQNSQNNITAWMSPTGLKTYQEGLGLISDAIDGGVTFSSVSNLLTIPGPAIPIAPLITGDPADALPPGIDLKYGSAFALIIGSEVVLGDKNVVVYDFNKAY